VNQPGPSRWNFSTGNMRERLLLALIVAIVVIILRILIGQFFPRTPAVSEWAHTPNFTQSRMQEEIRVTASTFTLSARSFTPPLLLCNGAVTVMGDTLYCMGRSVEAGDELGSDGVVYGRLVSITDEGGGNYVALFEWYNPPIRR
jgi:hypothetical protein